MHRGQYKKINRTIIRCPWGSKDIMSVDLCCSLHPTPLQGKKVQISQDAEHLKLIRRVWPCITIIQTHSNQETFLLSRQLMLEAKGVFVCCTARAAKQYPILFFFLIHRSYDVENVPAVLSTPCITHFFVHNRCIKSVQGA